MSKLQLSQHINGNIDTKVTSFIEYSKDV